MWWEKRHFPDRCRHRCNERRSAREQQRFGSEAAAVFEGCEEEAQDQEMRQSYYDIRSLRCTMGCDIKRTMLVKLLAETGGGC